ncbi:MAG: carbamoyltransferase HypF [Candidatus Omnitrophica bacterium]|nr:carbamoyltransferase HypF [Candidatus Omnitrophota bacterium]
MHKAYTIRLEGVVQGVGFRPFVQRLADRFGVCGYVRNTLSGVHIHAETTAKTAEAFWKALFRELPPLARITHADRIPCPAQGLSGFTITESRRTGAQSCLISPDAGICPGCLKELFTSTDRRYLYPFINCTDCGPRFSIIQSLPYDRPNTTMKNFRMCPSCNAEYLDATDRRFHAQPNACPECGPQVELVAGHPAENALPAHILKRAGHRKSTEAVAQTIKLLQKGTIVAVKGIGGFHIACDAFNQTAVRRLRLLKHRPSKPFAVMVKDAAAARKLCRVSALEEKILTSPERPIVILQRKSGMAALEDLAPDNNCLGVMLCYAPLHYLLFSRELSSGKPLACLVMTSGNAADEPIETDNAAALKNLGGICGYFLVHDRDIYNRVDDSIVQVIDGRPVVLRRARGHAPLPFSFDKKLKQTLSCGAELKNTFCLTKGSCAFLSQYIGDLKTRGTYASFDQAVKRLATVFAVKPAVICHDLHPDYLSTRYALEQKAKDPSLKLRAIQHHEAHLAGVITEHRIRGKVIGVCFDGIGYGSDGHIWGGEFFFGDLKRFVRAGHLAYVAMPGGDKATQEPFRMAISYLHRTFGDGMYRLPIDFITAHRDRLEQITRLSRLHPILTSSAGRLFDAVSALAGICDIITYEAQAAIRLQMYAERSKTRAAYDFTFEYCGPAFTMQSNAAIRRIVTALERRVPKETIARKFHTGLAAACRSACEELRRRTRINTVCLSGGVFQNKLFLELTAARLRERKFTVYYNELLPTNDGAIALGQAALANAG